MMKIIPFILIVTIVSIVEAAPSRPYSSRPSPAPLIHANAEHFQEELHQKSKDILADFDRAFYDILNIKKEEAPRSSFFTNNINSYLSLILILGGSWLCYHESRKKKHKNISSIRIGSVLILVGAGLGLYGLCK